jgi:hypothetical protein
MLALRMRADEAAQPHAAARRTRSVGDAAVTRPLPAYVTHALARYRLLHDIPFAYLVPDMRLLPLESVRFFTLDPEWLDALAEGALQAGGSGSRERRRAESAAPEAMIAAQNATRLVRQVGIGRLVVDATLLDNSAAEGPAVVSGMLLNSALVSGWSGLKLCAWRSAAPADVPLGIDAGELAQARPELVVPLLRLERLAPSVLLVLFDGMPRLVWLEEPHQGVQFGLEEAGSGYQVALRDQQGHNVGKTVTVPMRSGVTQGVVDVAGLAAAVDQAQPLVRPRGSAALALQLLQAPSRQRFHN